MDYLGLSPAVDFVGVSPTTSPREPTRSAMPSSDHPPLKYVADLAEDAYCGVFGCKDTSAEDAAKKAAAEKADNEGGRQSSSRKRREVRQVVAKRAGSRSRSG